MNPSLFFKKMSGEMLLKNPSTKPTFTKFPNPKSFSDETHQNPWSQTEISLENPNKKQEKTYIIQNNTHKYIYTHTIFARTKPLMRNYRT